MELNIFLDMLEKLEFNENKRLDLRLNQFLNQFNSVSNYQWTALYFIPSQIDFILPETVLITDSKLKSIFNLDKALFKKTLLYKLKVSKKNKYSSIKLPKNNPEFNKDAIFNCFKYTFPKFTFIIEISSNFKYKVDVQIINKFINYLQKILNKESEEKYYKSRVDELLNLIEISKFLNSTMNLRSLLNKLFSEVKHIMMSEGCSLILIDKETGELKFQIVKGKKSQIIKEVTIPANKGFYGWIAKNKQPLIVNNVKNDKRFYRRVDEKSGFKTRNLIGVPLIINNEIIGIMEAVNKKKNESFSQSDMEIFVALANQAAIAIQNAQYYEKLNDLFLSTLKSLSTAIEAKDKYTRGHTERVTKYSVLLAKELEFEPEFVKTVEIAGLLHDIGKIGVDEKILMKPARLTDEEYKIIKEHPRIGEEIMEPIKELKEILPGIRNHHERWDGNGYPDGLKKKEIPLLGRIIALADAYDAMTSDRPYRKGFNSSLAIKEIANCTGTQFDPELADKFITLIKKDKKRGLL